MKFLFGALIFVIIIAYLQVESNKKSPEEIAQILEKQRKSFEAIAQGRPENENLPATWPPEMNKEYPEIALIDQNGKRFNLHNLQDKIVILEYIDFTSPISQAQSGAGLMGAYGTYSNSVDEYSVPFADVLQQNNMGSINFPGDNVVSLKIIVYGASDQATLDDAENWARHFNLKTEDGYIVAVAQKDLRDEATMGMIGGYQLLDKKLRLRVDSSGIAPKHNLKLTLLPLFEKLYQK